MAIPGLPGEGHLFALKGRVETSPIRRRCASSPLPRRLEALLQVADAAQAEVPIRQASGLAMWALNAFVGFAHATSYFF